MSIEHPDQFTMIGLHKLAAQFGDGMVPELYELLSSRARMVEDNSAIIEFPSMPHRPRPRDVFGLASGRGDNILSFPSGAASIAPTKDRA